jgi:hypothetical protein
VSFLPSYSISTVIAGAIVSTLALNFHACVDLVTANTPLQPDLGWQDRFLP